MPTTTPSDAPRPWTWFGLALALLVTTVPARAREGSPGPSPCDHVLFLRQVSDEFKSPIRQAVVVADLAAGKVRTRDIMEADELHIDFIPLHVRGGTLYTLHKEKLLAIDVGTGKVTPLATGLWWRTDAGPRLYAAVGDDKERPGVPFTLRVYDFESASCRDVCRVTDPATELSELAVSPDGRHLAWFEPSAPGMSRVKTLDLETGAIRLAGEPIRVVEPGEGRALYSSGPPLAWASDRTVITVRRGPLPANPPPLDPAWSHDDSGSARTWAPWVTTIDIHSGAAHDVAPVPGRAFGVLGIVRPSVGGDLALVDNLGAESPRYLVHLEADNLIAAPTRAGAFHLTGGGYKTDRLLEAARILHDARVVAQTEGNPMPLAISPDGRRVAWQQRHMPSHHDDNPVRYYDAAERKAHTLSGGPVSGPFLWFKAEALKPARPDPPPGSRPIQPEP
jgi:hypothetical protein